MLNLNDKTHRRLLDYSSVHSTGLEYLKSSWDTAALAPAALVSFYVLHAGPHNGTLRSAFTRADTDPPGIT